MAIRQSLFALGLGAAMLLAVSTQSAEDAKAAASSSDSIATDEIRLSPTFGPEFQRRNPRWGDWEEEKPYISEGKTYTDEQIQKAVKQGVEYILDQQREDGSWDVKLTGLLGQTADDAVDTIIATSLSGIALRDHAGVDQERINKALEKARLFVADRITRGKLPTRVQYACWRYAYGIKFIANEYKYLHESDEEGRERLETVLSRMRDSLIKMQLIPQDKSFSEGDPMPATLGIRVSPPTMDDYLGGAPIESFVEGSLASRITAGSLGKLRPGDRIFKFGKKRIENAFDFYSAEADIVEGKEYRIYVKRDGITSLAKIKAEKTWPADLGVTVKDWTDGKKTGAEIVSFRRGSVLKAEGAEVGDVIVKVNNKNVEDEASFLEEEADMPIWRKNIGVRIQRGKKRQTLKVLVRPRPTANLGFQPNDEDKNTENGVGVLAMPIDRRTRRPMKTPASEAGLRAGDFITEINGMKILGYDHYVDVVNKMPGYTPVTLKILRDGEESEIAYECGANPFPGWFGFTLDDNFEESNTGKVGRIGEIERHTPAYKAKMKLGDVITAFKFEGQTIDIEQVHKQYRGRYSRHWLVNYFMSNVFKAGDNVTVTVDRKGKSLDFDMVVAIAPANSVLAEGGWAYYPKGIAPSFTTAAIMIFLDEIEEIIGKDIRLPRKAHKAALAAIAGMREKDVRSKQWGYVYDQRPLEKELANIKDEATKKRARENWKDLRGHMGRIMVCELALGINGKRSKSYIRKSLNNWLERRDELDIVRNFPHTHYGPRFQNAAYYWLFGHYFALKSANYLGKDKTAKKAREVILSVTMQDQEPDGTWLGHHSFGKLCGTSLALMILGEFDHSWRQPSGAGGKPITPGGRPNE